MSDPVEGAGVDVLLFGIEDWGRFGWCGGGGAEVGLVVDEERSAGVGYDQVGLGLGFSGQWKYFKFVGGVHTL